MAREREVGTLWIGGALSWMEQVCLKSFVDKGQKITLFSYEDIPNVPKGVIRRDGREIIDTDDFIKYERKNSFALFADWFRLHMIKKCPGMIWIDTDVYCHKPATYDSDYVLGFELHKTDRINNAILGLPHDSDLLNDMIEFTDDRTSIAPFLPPKLKAQYKAQAKAGEPVHITQQPWGVWGPMMVSYFTKKHKLLDKVQPVEAFYPVTFRQRGAFMKPPKRAKALITKETTLLHLWASNKRPIGNGHDGLPPLGSYYEKITKVHDIVAPLAPIKGRARTVFDGALSEELDLKKVKTAADMTGQARSFLLTLYHKFKCDLYLINASPKGQFPPGRRPWVEPCHKFLITHGVPEDKIHIARSAKELKPVDVLCNLEGFGVKYELPGMAKILDSCLHKNSRLFSDFSGGSGGYKFLRKWGTVNTIFKKDAPENATIVRVCLQPHAK